MKKSILVTMLMMAVMPAVSQAGFLNGLDGTYHITSGDNCLLYGSEAPVATGKVVVESNTAGATVFVEVATWTLIYYMPVEFYNGSGDKTETVYPGGVSRGKETRVWETDEANRQSTTTTTTKVLFVKKNKKAELRQQSDGTLSLKLEDTKSRITECTMTKR